MNLDFLISGTVRTVPMQYLLTLTGFTLRSSRIFLISELQYPSCLSSTITASASPDFNPVLKFSNSRPLSMVSLSVLALLTRVMRLKDVLVDGVSAPASNSVRDDMNSAAVRFPEKEENSSAGRGMRFFLVLPLLFFLLIYR